MPLDVLGRTRATLMHSTSLHLDRKVRPSNLHRDGDRLLQLLIFNEEYLWAHVISVRRLRPCPLYTPPVAPTD